MHIMCNYAFIQGLLLHIAHSEAENPLGWWHPVVDREKGDGEPSLLLYAIHSPFYWWILKKTKHYSGFNNLYQKIRETRKLESIHECYFIERQKRVENQTKTWVWEDLSLWPGILTKNAVQEFHLYSVVLCAGRQKFFFSLRLSKRFLPS